ncbi:MAG: hypothetical protein JXX29_23150 [Deltaproteobacteria bacterium]|nr:hypothetical protein [Deltaproteobacteria bacterium]MBN2674598.1 hypothetical protein [Deltaproteobacteria bacterium]
MRLFNAHMSVLGLLFFASVWICGCFAGRSGVETDGNDTFDATRETDEPGCAAFNEAYINEWGSEVPGDSVEVELNPSDFGDTFIEVSGKLFLPSDVEAFQGRLMFIALGLGADEYACMQWREFARQNHLAVFLVSLLVSSPEGVVDTPWSTPEAAYAAYNDVVDALVDKAGRPDLLDAPLITWGHSAGGYLSTRIATSRPSEVLGFVSYHGSRLHNNGEDNGMYDLPGLFVVAAYDTLSIRSKMFEQAALGRENDAPWTLAIEEGGHHWDNNRGREFAIQYIEELLSHQLSDEHEHDGDDVDSEPDDDDSDNSDSDDADSLLTAMLEAGRLGRLEHHGVFDGDEEFELSGREVVDICEHFAYSDVENDPADHTWLFSESLADSWVDFCTGGAE